MMKQQFERVKSEGGKTEAKIELKKHYRQPQEGRDKLDPIAERVEQFMRWMS